MFLNKTIKDNKKLIDFCISEHKNMKILPDTYVIDLDQLYENAKMMLECARKNNVELFFMLKQIGRNPDIARELINMGYSGAVVVDYKEANVMIDNGIKIGNVGHLVQIPKMMLKKILLSKPEFFTVYSLDILKEINEICLEENIFQNIMLKIIDFDNDVIYEGQYGGFELSELEDNVDLLKSFSNLNIRGITSFPCILNDDRTNVLAATNNVKTILKGKKILKENGFSIDVLNMPSATAMYSIELISSLGATHGEPGHGLTGSTPHHLNIDNGEKLAMVYVTEVSHAIKKISYCYGGGYYRRGNLKNALINDKIVEVIPPSDESIDYYFGLKEHFSYGETVIMNFRTQLFVTRSNVLLVEGLKINKPTIKGVYDVQGKKI